MEICCLLKSKRNLTDTICLQSAMGYLYITKIHAGAVVYLHCKAFCESKTWGLKVQLCLCCKAKGSCVRDSGCPSSAPRICVWTLLMLFHRKGILSECLEINASLSLVLRSAIKQFSSSASGDEWCMWLTWGQAESNRAELSLLFLH